MGYEARMQEDILGLLDLFQGRVPDAKTHAMVYELAKDRTKWKRGHHVFDRVRKRNLKSIDSDKHVEQCQYCFEEVCLKSFFNETYPCGPFDSCSPYWVIKNAIHLARAVGIPVEDVVAVVAPGD